VHGPQRGEVFGEIDGGGRGGEVIGEQVGGPVGTTPVAGRVATAGEIDAGGTIGVPIDEDEAPVIILGVQILEAVLADREPQPPADPAAGGIDLTRLEEDLVGEVETGEV